MCFWNPQSGKSSSFKHIHAPQGNVLTRHASDAILSSLCIWNPQSVKLPSFKHIDAPQSNVSTHGASEAILFSVSIEIPYLENNFHLSIFMLLRSMCSRMVLLTQFYPHCAFETPNLQYYLHLSIFMLIRAMSTHGEFYARRQKDKHKLTARRPNEWA